MSLDYRIKYSIDNDNLDVYVTEFSTLQQLRLCKALTLLDTHTDKITAVQQIVKESIHGELADCSILDYIILLLKIRFISIGSTVSLKVEFDGKQTEFELDLRGTYDQLLKASNSIKDRSSLVSGIKVTYSLPSYNSLVEYGECIRSENYSIEDILPFLIKSIYFEESDTIFNLCRFSYKDRKNLCNNLPIEIYKEARLFLQEVTNYTSNVFLYKSSTNKDVYLNILSTTMYSYIEFLFDSDLANLHEQIFILTSMSGFTLSDISTMCELERSIYIGFIHQQRSSNSREDTTQLVDIPMEGPDQEEILMNQLFS